MMSSRRRKRGNGPFVVFILLIAAAAVTWGLWPEPDHTDAEEPPVAEVSDPVLTSPPTPVVEFRPQEETVVPPPPAPAPMTTVANN